jgi:hypothetical protein
MIDMVAARALISHCRCADDRETVVLHHDLVDAFVLAVDEVAQLRSVADMLRRVRQGHGKKCDCDLCRVVSAMDAGGMVA